MHEKIYQAIMIMDYYIILLIFLTGSTDKNMSKQILNYLRKNTELLTETNKTVKKLDSNYTKLSNDLKELKKKLSQVLKENDNQWYKVSSYIYICWHGFL